MAGDLLSVARAAAAEAGGAVREGEEEEEGAAGAAGGAPPADPWACFDGDRGGGGGGGPGSPALQSLPAPGTPAPPFAGLFAVSSLKGGPGLDALRSALLRATTPGPWAVPASSDAAPTDRGWPGIAAQAVAAELFTALRGDVPYTLDVRPVAWAGLADGSVRGEVEVVVPREAVRGIVLGVGGGRLRAVGMAARAAVKEAMAAAYAAAAAEADAALAEMDGQKGEAGEGAAGPPPRRLAPPPKDVHLIVKVRVDTRARRNR